MLNSHRQRLRDETRQFCRVGVGSAKVAQHDADNYNMRPASSSRKHATVNKEPAAREKTCAQ